MKQPNKSHPNPNRGFVSTPDNPGNSKLMRWISEHIGYQGDGCLIWPFSRTRDGYGFLGRAGKAHKVHRYICQWVHGAPPTPKHQAAHSCNNGHNGCVNPRHVRWKTPSENHKEATPHPRYKLNETQVAEIRKLKGAELVQVTAGRYGVTEATIRKIQNGTNWPTGKRSPGGFADPGHPMRSPHPSTDGA